MLRHTAQMLQRAALWPAACARPLCRQQFSASSRLMPATQYLRPPGRPSSMPLWTPLLFCVGTSAGIFTACALADVRYRRQQRLIWQRRADASAGSSLPQGLRTVYLHAQQQWRSIPEAQRVVYGIMAANLGVHLLWRIPRLQGFMLTYFAQQLPPNQPRLVTFITSNFSHAGLAHLAINMLALNGFGGIVAQEMGACHFTAFYLTAGIASSLVTYLGRLGRPTGGRSLGASGAVIACFAIAALQHPDAEGAFIFLPGVPIRLENLLYMLVSADVLGVTLSWRWLDHWGHLGGAGFGAAYNSYGQQVWDRLRRACAKLKL